MSITMGCGIKTLKTGNSWSSWEASDLDFPPTDTPSDMFSRGRSPAAAFSKSAYFGPQYKYNLTTFKILGKTQDNCNCCSTYKKTTGGQLLVLRCRRGNTHTSHLSVHCSWLLQHRILKAQFCPVFVLPNLLQALKRRKEIHRYSSWCGHYSPVQSNTPTKW